MWDSEAFYISLFLFFCSSTAEYQMENMELPGVSDCSPIIWNVSKMLSYLLTVTLIITVSPSKHANAIIGKSRRFWGCFTFDTLPLNNQEMSSQGDR